MKLKWLGHACFLITSDKGTRIITDPYAPQGALAYGAINESADVVTVSHDHFDHNNSGAVKGNPTVVKGAGKQQAKGIEFTGVATYHDEAQGSQRGNNVIYCFTVDGLRVCHVGDLGHVLTPEQVKALGQVDVLLVPVGGTYTVDAAGATQVVSQLNPKVVVPMHVKNAHCTFPIAPMEEFLKGKKGVRQISGSETELKAPPATQEILVLNPAL